MTDHDQEHERTQQALAVLEDHYDLEECSRCEVREEWGLVLGDADCAIGVAVCPNCGYESRCCTAAPDASVLDHPYDHMHKLAMRWVPPWHPGDEDVRADWRCACGKTWRSSDEARIHVYQQHPDRTHLDLVDHDRYPWDNVGLGEEEVMPRD